MIHLAGDEPVKRALHELEIFAEEKMDGAIIENYHGSFESVIETLKITSKIKTGLILGVNILPNEFHSSIPLASKYGAQFVQLDHVAGKYTSGEIDAVQYNVVKQRFPDIAVFGGVHPKYYIPVPGSNITIDIMEGMKRAEAIVVTGAGTGKETPLEKIMLFRHILGKDYPLIVGAGLTPENAEEQLGIANGAIVGSCLKGGNTYNPIDRVKVRELVSAVREIKASGSQ